MPPFFVLMLGVFALTLFTSATLLFMVQPMIGKMILPMLGGTPAVWNTCMVFFQALLLAGYAYSHATTSRLGERRQALFHLFLLPIPFLFIPLSVTNNWLIQALSPGGDPESLLIGTERSPVYILLFILFFSVGVPFFVVSTSAPMLQKWFSNTLHPQARDPYFLYGASNLGSMLALVGYPAVIEPHLAVEDQAFWWAIGYGLLAALIACCAVLLWKTPAPEVAAAPAAPAPTANARQGITTTPARAGKEGITTAPGQADPLDPAGQPVTWWRRLRWVLLAAIPSSFMLGVTTYLTTDIAAIPLLWIPPLALYLLSFIIVFSNVPRWVHTASILALPLVLLLLIFLMLSGITPKEVLIPGVNIKLPGLFISIGLHLLAMFTVAMVCHGELARDRPSTRYLTEFFLLMSVGGVVGGMFNGLFAPVIFWGNAEYPIAMVLACLLLPPLEGPSPAGASESAQAGGRAGGQTIAARNEFVWGDTADIILAVLFLAAACILLFLRWKDNDLVLTPNWKDDGTMVWKLRTVLLEGNGSGLLLALSIGLGVGAFHIYRNRERWRTATLDVVLPLTLGLLVLGLTWGLWSNAFYYKDENGFLRWRISQAASYLGVSRDSLFKILTYGVPAVLCYTFVERSFRFGLGVGVLLLAAGFADLFHEGTLYRERSFFGVLRVESRYDDDTEWGLTRRLMHGTTLHGVQYHTDLKEAQKQLALAEEKYPELARRSNEELKQDIDRIEAESMVFFEFDKQKQALEELDKKAGTKSVADLEAELAELEKDVPEKKKLGELSQELEDLKKKDKADTEAVARLEKRVELRRHIALKQVMPPWELIIWRNTVKKWAELEDSPLSYYHRSGPVGQVFGVYNTIDRHIGVIGLGTGSMSCYGQKDQKMTFFDIDPAVKRISFDTDKYFTFVTRARERGVDMQELVLGDARLTMKRQEDGKFGIIIVDAFSSDAIPIHLITDQAVRMLTSKLREDGILMYHISNRYLDLRPVLAHIAEVEDLAALYNSDSEDEFHNKSGSTWVALARKPVYLSKLMTAERISEVKKSMQEVLRPLVVQPGLVGSMGQILSGVAGELKASWRPLEVDPKVKLWTDTYSDLLSVFIWPRR